MRTKIIKRNNIATCLPLLEKTHQKLVNFLDHNF